MRSLLQTQRSWDSDEECTEEKCWKLLDLDDELIEEDLMPEFQISLKERERDYDDLNEDRKKWVIIRFVNKWNLEIKFVVEKKKKHKETKLLDIAGETVAKLSGDQEKIKDLEIPKTLKKEVIEWLRDLKWRTI